MEANTSSGTAQIIYKGPRDDSPDTLRRIKAVFIADFEFSVEQVKEFLENAPVVIKEASNPDLLEKYYLALKRAGANVSLVRDDDLDNDDDDGVLLEFDLDDPHMTTQIAREKPAPVHYLEETSLDDIKDLHRDFEDKEQLSASPVETTETSESKTEAAAFDSTQSDVPTFDQDRPDDELPRESESIDAFSDSIETNLSAEAPEEQLIEADGEANGAIEPVLEEAIDESALIPDKMPIDLEEEDTSVEPSDNFSSLIESSLELNSADDELLASKNEKDDSQNDASVSAALPVEPTSTPATNPEATFAFQSDLEEGLESVIKAAEAISEVGNQKVSEPSDSGDVLEFFDDAAGDPEKTQVTPSGNEPDTVTPQSEKPQNSNADKRPVTESLVFSLDDAEEEKDVLKDSPLEGLIDRDEDIDLELKPLPQSTPEPEKTSSEETKAKPPVSEVAVTETQIETPKVAPLASLKKVKDSEMPSPPPASLVSKKAGMNKLTPVLGGAALLIGSALAYFFLTESTPQHPLPEQSSQATAPSEPVVATLEPEVLDLPIVRETEAVVSLDGFYQGNLNVDGVIVDYRLTLTGNRLQIIDLAVTGPEPEPLTPQQIVRGIKRAPWLRRVEHDAVTLEASEGLFSTRQRARAYVEHDGFRKRLVANSNLSFSVNPDENKLLLSLDVSHRSSGDRALPFFIEPLEGDSYQFRVRLDNLVLEKGN